MKKFRIHPLEERILFDAAIAHNVAAVTNGDPGAHLPNVMLVSAGVDPHTAVVGFSNVDSHIVSNDTNHHETGQHQGNNEEHQNEVHQNNPTNVDSSVANQGDKENNNSKHDDTISTSNTSIDTPKLTDSSLATNHQTQAESIHKTEAPSQNTTETNVNDHTLLSKPDELTNVTQDVNLVTTHTKIDDTVISTVDNTTTQSTNNNDPVAATTTMDQSLMTMSFATTNHNSDPVGVPDSYDVIQGTPLIVSAQDGVLHNDSGTGPLAAIQLGSQGGGHGLLFLNFNGSFIYIPRSDFTNGDVVTFSYKVVDTYGNLSDPIDITFNIVGINHAPSFTIANDPPVALEDSGTHTVTGFASNISSGDTGQTVNFGITAITAYDSSGHIISPNDLFTAAPVISAAGTLTYTLAPNANGSADVTVVLHDSGGTAHGGDDTSSAKSFHINVTPVNDAPSFTVGGDQTAVEDSGAHSVNNFITNISNGPSNESGQTHTFNVTNDNNAMFSVQPTISANGTLNYTLAANANGSATISVVIHDSGGTSNGGVDTSAPQIFHINTTSVNDAPSFTVGGDQTATEDSGAHTVNNFITNISKGPGNESGQTLNFNVTNDNNALFSVQPTITDGGTLNYTLAADANGSATITVVLHDSGGTSNGGVDTSAPQIFHINVTPVNDVPSFTVGTDQTAVEDSGAHSVNNFITNISKGPSNESGQTLNFNVTNDNNALFSVQPTITDGGTLNYTLAANANGSATISVVLHDSGGTSNGGVDTSTPQTFHINITPVNDVPSFTVGGDQTAVEDSGAHSVNNFITNISKGSGNESGQTLNFNVTNDNNALFSVQPTITDGGTLNYTLAADANGSATISVVLKDSGGTSNGGVDTSAPQAFHISITPVNDVPSFTVGGDQTAVEDSGAHSVNNFITNISKGPGNESGQTLTFNVTNDNNAMFSVQPTISANGTLNYTLAADANGSATITVVLKDSGGTSNGGVDTSAPQTFHISTTTVNDVPSFTVGGDQTAVEDSGAHTVNNFITDISKGPGNESGQTLTFNVTNDNNALFSVQPTITDGGTLNYTLAADANGSATITVVLKDSGGTSNGGVDTSAPQTFHINITPVNDVPSFTVGGDQTAVEDSGAHTVNNFITDISKGPGNESGQTLTFNVTNDNNAMFSVQPTISADGTLNYTLAADANGSATISVVLKDSGGTSNGGVDTSAPQTFHISITPVNDVPSFTVGGDQTAVEDSGAHTVNNFITDISKGPGNESGQTLTFNVTNDNNAMFSVQPTISADGTLNYTLAADANGSATISVVLKDSGGTSNGGVDTSAPQTFHINITPVNDVPSFTVGGDQTAVEDSGAHSVNNFITNISKGPGNESGQTLTFNVTNDNNAMFSVQPTISANGTLNYTLAADANGSATITVVLKDSGGTSNGGVDTSAPQTFHINITPVNDVPSFTVGGDQTAVEDSGAHTVNNFITDISKGPGNESGQTLTFNVTNDNNAIFSVQPTISADGTLNYTLAADANGSATITVVLKDSGGTSSGGVDTNVPQTFHINITPVDDPPTFTIGANQIEVGDGGAHTIANFITNIIPGPSNESDQTVSFIVNNDNPALFTVQPTISSDGTLTYALAPNVQGNVTITVQGVDSGGATASGNSNLSIVRTFTINVTPPPTVVSAFSGVAPPAATAQSAPPQSNAISLSQDSHTVSTEALQPFIPLPTGENNSSIQNSHESLVIRDFNESKTILGHVSEEVDKHAIGSKESVVETHASTLVNEENNKVIEMPQANITNDSPTLKAATAATVASAVGVKDMNALKLSKRAGFIIPAKFDYVGLRIQTEGPSTTWKDGGDLILLVALKSMPSAKVRVTLKSSNEALGIVKPSVLEFNSSDWYIAREVRIIGQGGSPGHVNGGGEVVGGERYYITALPLESSDSTYREFEIDPFSITAIEKPADN